MSLKELRGLSREMIAEYELSRASLALKLSKTHDDDRSLWELLGYPTKLGFDNFKARYLRGGIGARVIDAYPSAAWSKPPIVQTDPDQETEFEKAVMELDKRLKLWHKLERVDRLSQMGRFSILLLGVADGNELNKPVEPRSLKPDDLIYLQPYAEGRIEIKSFEENSQETRYGLPTIYEIDLSAPAGSGRTRKKPNPVQVHHSRVVHVAQNLLEDNVYGFPRAEQVYNLLIDLDKLVGGGAEIWWRSAIRGVLFSADEATLGAEEEDDKTKETQKKLDEMIHGLRRVVLAEGVNMQEMKSRDADSSKIAHLVLQMISATTGIPIRILTGSERGEQASSQDEENWRSRVTEYRTKFVQPVIINQLFDRLIGWGLLTDEEYEIAWQPLSEPTEEEKVDAANGWLDAADKLSGGDPASIIPPDLFVERYLPWVNR